MLKAIIFDMDGVLIDSEPIHLRVEQDIFAGLGFRLSEEELGAFMGINSYEMFSTLKKRYRLSPSVAELVELERRSYLEELHSHGVSIIAGMKDLIATLHRLDFKLALASSAPHEQISLIMEQDSLGDFFPVRISGDEVEQSKPHPEIFLKAASGLGVEARNCCVIEDSENGVIAAKKAMMACIGYRNPSSGKQNLSLADWSTDSVASIRNHFLEGRQI